VCVSAQKVLEAEASTPSPPGTEAIVIVIAELEVAACARRTGSARVQHTFRVYIVYLGL
jgi:hypothetical protein